MFNIHRPRVILYIFGPEGGMGLSKGLALGLASGRLVGAGAREAAMGGGATVPAPSSSSAFWSTHRFLSAS